MLFEVVVVENPTDKAAKEDGAVEKLILAPQFVIAKSEKAAVNQVVMKNVDALQKADPDRMEILVRPFGRG